MNNLHHPDLARCEALTKAGFPYSELYWDSHAITKIEDKYGITEDGEFVCPSIAEILDVIPPYIEECDNKYEFQIRQNGEGAKLVMYVCGTGMIYHEYGTLPNALANLILWLIDQGYRFTNNKLTK